jgi:hypothetical protein
VPHGAVAATQTLRQQQARRVRARARGCARQLPRMARRVAQLLLLVACAVLAPRAALAQRMNVEVTDRVQPDARSNEFNWRARARGCSRLHTARVQRQPTR